MEVIAQHTEPSSSLVGVAEWPLPPECSLLPGPLLQRQVWLRAGPAKPLVYACSWWNAAAFPEAMRSPERPIWRNLAAARTEAYRELSTLVLGDCPQLATAFGRDGPFWGRWYVLHIGGAPLTVVYEAFSPALAAWLGPGGRQA